MIKFVLGLIIGALIVIGAVTIYSLAQMAGMYDRTMDKYFDED